MLIEDMIKLYQSNEPEERNTFVYDGHVQLYLLTELYKKGDVLHYEV